jgi:hypothetical protein
LGRENSKLFEIIPPIVFKRTIKMPNNETLRFASKFVFPQTLIVVIIFFVIIYVFPTLRLAFREFTLIYWGFSIVSFLLNYQAIRWTKYVIKNYGLQKEKNPEMRKMFAKGDLKKYWIGWLGLYLLLFFFYIIGINAPTFLPFLIFPSWILVILLYDFLNDFYWVRKLKTNSRTLEKENTT